ncbi:hypothetical protein [Halosegnis longus]|uniref:DZANK-type domain-containing protein n=1 Tax=Halosegnis longus TaxID=2216012 RepID=A0AAJ4UVP8_9EURY|nr:MULTISPECIES: hypothetical protein [Halobacteriales]RNJ26242.1 hypothetical protein Nmn1133_05835 [Salella cibi]
MEWYCTECGRPSDTNGGTCECGSTSFERAVVQVAKECTTCGTRVPEHTTTCPDCGFTGFEPLGEPQPRDEGSYIEWRCEKCGNEHPRHTPPCDRCGHEVLERVRVDAADFDVDEHVAGYDEPGDGGLFGFSRSQAFGGVLIGSIVVVFLLGTAGIGPAADLGGPAPPDPAVVESSLVAEVNDQRTAAGLDPLVEDGELTRIAATRTERAAGDGQPQGASAAFSEAGYDCAEPILTGYRIPDASADADLGARIADRVTDDEPRLGGAAERVGVDARVVDGTLYVAVAAC